MFITLEITSKKRVLKHVKKRVTLFSDPLLYPPLPTLPTAGSANNSVLKLDPIFFKDHKEFV